MVTAGATVEGGFYLNRDAWDLIAINGKDGVLPGNQGQRYIKLPVWAVLAIAPAAGGLFVVFLPLIGFALVGLWAGRNCWSGGKRLLARRRSQKPASKGAKAASDTDAGD